MYRQPIKMLLLALALPVVSLQALAAPAGPSKSVRIGGDGPAGTCGGCFEGLAGLVCKWGNGLGGYHYCWTDGILCDIDNRCDGPVVYLEASVLPATLGEIAEAHPRVAATLWAVAHGGAIGGEGSTFWYNSPITAADVETLVQNGTVELEKTPGDLVVYRHYLDQEPATGGWSLVIKPERASDLDGPFSAFVLELKQVEGTGSFVAGGWSLF